MSPARPSPSSSSRRNSPSGFKPYTRGVTPIVVPSTMSDGRSDMSSPQIGNTTPNTNNSLERPGFPTYAQYKQVERTYLQSLTPRRQGKALISQAMFDRIWDVLHQPDAPSETAQFRFWARKMFTVSKTHRVTLGIVDNGDDTPQEVLLHDDLLVAIQEQLYDLLCYCHGSTGHGGRDKTCAFIRKHYTWVPKDLVSNFVKACPTCILKKCGNVEATAAMAHMAEVAKPALEETPSPPSLRDFFNLDHTDGSAHSHVHTPSSPFHNNGIPWPTTGGSRDSPISSSILDDDPVEAAYREAILRPRGIRSFSGIGGLPMSREVSLYKGLPNGWQYRHNDYASAHAEFMRTKDLPDTDENNLDLNVRRRPRVPSIAPLLGPDRFPHAEFETLDPSLDEAEILPSPEANLSQIDVTGRQEEGHGHGHNHAHMSGMSMGRIFTAESQGKAGQDQEAGFMHQIDPILLSFSRPSSSTQNDSPQSGASKSPARANANNHGTSPSNFASPTNCPSITRAGAPHRLNLELSTGKTFKALLAYRDGLGEGNVTPESPHSNNSYGRRWHPGHPSPASSESSSSSSQLSAFSIMGDGSPMTTPASSAITTPVDECPGGSSGSSSSAVEFVKGKGPERLEDGEVALSDGIQAVGMM